MKTKSYDTVSETIKDLKSNGYTIDFSCEVDTDNLKTQPIGKALSPNNYVIDQYFRFEGNSDPGDAMIVYAISSIDDKIKGTVMNAYGVYADNTCTALVHSLKLREK